MQSGGVDHRGGGQFGAVIRYNNHSSLRPIDAGKDPIYCRFQGQQAARVLQIAQQGQHQSVAVHDAGGRRLHRRHAGQSGLERTGLFAADQAQVVHPVDQALGHDPVQIGHLGLARRHDQLAAALVADAALGAVGIELVAPLNAQPRLQRALRVIQAGMDHFAVARTGAGADGIGRFQQHHFAPLEGQRPRHGQAHHARADHHHIDPIHHFPPFSGARWRPGS